MPAPNHLQARLIKGWDTLRSSYWFIPSLMTAGAAVLAVGLTEVDARLGSDWIESTGWLNANQPAGARALLSTIAGSMITVAGVTFSITIAAVAYASSQFGPRLLNTFMRDTGNQITLGAFIATFIYGLLVLRTIRAAEDPSALTPNVFVPHVAILGALTLAVLSVGVLIYFIHHVPASIHASHVIAEVGHELSGRIAHLYPEMLGRPIPEDVDDERLAESAEADVAGDMEAFYARAAPVRMEERGYVQHVAEEVLLDLAQTHDLVLSLAYRPGDFAGPQKALAYVYPAERLTDDVASRVRLAFAWGRQRTPVQDVLFLVNELVEIAGRALSPGVNDPFTAITCMDWLGAALIDLAHREIPPARRYDAGGRLRLIARPITFEAFASAAFDQLRPYAAGDRNASLHMMKVLAEVLRGVPEGPARSVLLGHATALRDACSEALPERDAQTVRARHQALVRLHLTEGTAEAATLAESYRWLDGTG